ncbi:MAG: hypothetical protein HUJ59_03100, partial [Bacilli bacterium]|nr:hypothetical protein [Bacilli bacterium]
DRYYETIAEAPSIYEIANGGFESGSLAGWTILEGQAFSNNGVNHEEVWWFENISYCRDGDYHYGYYKPEATGKMRSTSFILGGSGYISFKLGGCKRNNLTYLSVKLETSTGDIEVARFSNDRYWDFQFPYVANGMRLLNMNQYVADLSKYLGQTLYFEVVDLDDTPEDLGCITLDSIETYYVEKPTFTNVDHFKANTLIYPDIEIESEYQVKNGTFETGDLTGWTLNGGIGEVTSDDVWWEVNSFNKKGTYLFNGLPFENRTGSLKSSSFTVGGTGKISFLMGGGRDPRLCYVSIKDTNTNEEYARFANTFFHDIGGELINKGSNLANMNQYVADISNLLGKDVYIEVVDNAKSDWGLITVDSFITYYENELSLPTKYYEARNILPKAPLGQGDEYQVTNGDFETGDLTGWTVTNGQKILDIAFGEVWWNEWYDFNKGKEYFLSGWAAGEDKTGALTSQTFTVGGIGKMTFKLGGGKDNTLSYIEIIDADTSEVLRRYANYKFNDVNPSPHYYSGKIIDLSLEGIYEANMVDYVADLSSLMGKEVKIRIVDQAINNWGLLFVDEFITYYTSEEQLPKCLPAINTL